MLSVLVITISIFVFLVFVRNLQKTRENFKNKFRENFANHSIRNVHVDTEIKEDNGTEEEGEGTNAEETSEGEGTNAEGEGTNVEGEGTNVEQAKCDVVIVVYLNIVLHLNQVIIPNLLILKIC